MNEYSRHVGFVSVKQTKKVQRNTAQQQASGTQDKVLALQRALLLINAEPSTSPSLPHKVSPLVARKQSSEPPNLYERLTSKLYLLVRLCAVLNLVPAEVDGKEQYFMDQVAMGEQLAIRGTYSLFSLTLPLLHCSSKHHCCWKLRIIFINH